MMEIISKILGSKIFSVSVLVIILVLLVVLGLEGCKNKQLENKISDLEKTIDKQGEDIVNLNNQIQMKDLEIHYLQKGMTIATDFEGKKEEALENESTTKQEILQTVMSNEEVQDWWNTPIPDDVLNLITCH